MKPGLIPRLIAALAFMVACNDQNKVSAIRAEKAMQLDSLPGTCPFVTSNTAGDIFVSWARAINDSSFVFCYASSKDKGKSFDSAIAIPGSDNIQPHSENLPKIIVKRSGEIMALWGAANPNSRNKYSGLVYYSRSFDKGKTWTPRETLVKDTASYDQRYYDVTPLPNGDVAIIWLDNRKTNNSEGSALYFATTDGSNGFQNEKMIAQGCCQCCRTDLFVDSKAGIHVLYRGIIKDSIRDMLYSFSPDGGENFSEPRLISNDNWVIKGCPHTGPAMTENKEGLHFAWFTGGANKGCFYTRSSDNGNNFTHHDRISPFGAHPQLSAFPDGKLAVVWDESVKADNKYYKRIGFQLRMPNGEREKQAYITADTLIATYPVVMPVNNNETIVVYSIKKSGKEFIQYQWLRV